MVIHFDFAPQAKLRERDSEIESAKNAISEKQESISQFQQELLKCKIDLEEREKKMSELQKLEVLTVSFV